MGRTPRVFLQIGGGDRLVDIGRIKDADPGDRPSRNAGSRVPRPALRRQTRPAARNHSAAGFGELAVGILWESSYRMHTLTPFTRVEGVRIT
jgi:hypothetical protein